MQPTELAFDLALELIVLLDQAADVAILPPSERELSAQQLQARSTEVIQAAIAAMQPFRPGDYIHTSDGGEGKVIAISLTRSGWSFYADWKDMGPSFGGSLEYVSRVVPGA